MMFIYFALVFFTYIASVFVALFLEYPFRTMSKVVFSPPKKILRLNRDLARELNTHDRMIVEYNESELEESMSENNSQIKGRGDQMFEDIDEIDGDGDDQMNGEDEDRPQSKNKKALDLSLQMPGGGGGAGLINNTTFSALMSSGNDSNKISKKQRSKKNVQLLASDISDRE
jgi:hypothetical protein